MAIDLTLLNNTSFALLIWYIREGEEDEAKVFGGVATWNPTMKHVEVRCNGDENPIMILADEQLERIRIVTDEVREILLNCEYGITLSMTDLPDGNQENYKKAGLIW